MFVILSVKKINKGKTKIETERYDLENSYFYKVKVRHRFKRPPRRKIVETLYNINLPVIGENIPEYEGMLRVNDRRFRAVLLSNAVANLSAGSVVISDRFGEYPYCLERIMKRTRQVHIITENPEVYARENIKVFSSLGAAASISEEPISSKCDILFSPFADSSRTFADTQILVGEGGFELESGRAGIPYKYRKLAGEDVDDITLGAALWQNCNETYLEDIVPERIVNKTSGAFIKTSKPC